MSLSDYITAAILSKQLGVANATANAILKESGAGEKVGNSTFYSREAVRGVLRERHENLFVFMGFMAPQGASETLEEADNA